MQIETLAVHAGYSPDPTTKSAAVPLYQTTAYAFDNAQHGADLFDPEGGGQHLHPHHEPDHRRAGTARRGAGRRRGGPGHGLGHGGHHGAIQTIAETGDNIISASTLYGGTTTCLPTPSRYGASRCALPTRATRPALPS